MRIAHVLQHFRPGGIEKHCLTLSTTQSRNHTCLVVGCYSDRVMEQEFREAGVATALLGCRNGHDSRLPWKLLRTLLAFRPDVVHFHVEILGALAVLPVLRSMSVRIVLTEHMYMDAGLFTRARRISIEAWHHLANAVIYVSRHSMDEASKILSASHAAKRRVVYNGVVDDPLPFAIPPLDARGLVVGAMARLERGKGWDAFLEIARQLRSRLPDLPLEFRVCGDGSQMGRLKEQARTSGVDDVVHFLGYVKDPLREMSSWSAYLLLSEYEGFPLAVAEAMAVGAPIVGRLPRGGTGEMCEGVYALHAAASELEILDQLEACLSTDRERYGALAEAARCNLLSRFSRGHMFRGVESAYSSKP